MDHPWARELAGAIKTIETRSWPHCPRCDSPARSLPDDRIFVAGPSRDRLFDLFSPVEREMYAAIGGGRPEADRRTPKARSAA